MKKNLFVFIIIFLFAYAFSTENIKKIDIVSSSTLIEQGKNSSFYSSENIMDNSYRSWVEGVEGDGIGEFISFEFESPIDIKEIGIRNGYGDLRYYFANNRVKYFEIYVNDEYQCTFRVADTFELYRYSFLRFNNVKKISFKIKDVYQGAKYSDTCINEIYFFTNFLEKTPDYKEDEYTQNAKNAFTNYSQQFDTFLYTSNGTPLILHPINPPSKYDVWCFNDMEFYIYRNGKWELDNSNPIFSVIKKDIESAKENKYSIIFNFGQATGYSGDLYAYIMQVTASSYTIYEYDFDGISFKPHDIEYKSER